MKSFEAEIEKCLGLPESNRLKYEPLLPSSSEIGRLISAFSNTEGGILVLGMLSKNNKVSVTGLSDDFQVNVVLANTMSKLSPSPAMQYDFIQYKGKKLFTIRVQKSFDIIKFNQSAYKIKAKKIYKLNPSSLINQSNSYQAPTKEARLNQILKYLVDNPGLINVNKHTVRETIFKSQITLQEATQLMDELKQTDRVKIYGGRYIGVAVNTKSFLESGGYVNSVIGGSNEQDSGKKNIFVSYNWAEKATANRLYEHLKARGFSPSMDDRRLAYKDSISSFMESIRGCDFAILIISEKYLMSENCMTEVLHILKERNSFSKILPIRQEEVKIFKSEDRIKYIQYWRKQVDEKENLLKGVDATSAIEEIRKLKTAKRIYQDIGDFLSEIADMITSTVEEQEKTDYQSIVDYIDG